MPQLINAKTNLPEDVHQDQAQQAFLSGTHNLPASQPVSLNDPQGKPVSVDASEVHAAITKGGYSFPTQSQLDESAKQEQYGEGVGNEAASFALGAGNAATFGGVNQVLAKSGLVSQEALKEIPDRNPISHVAGTSVGIIAPALVGDEAGILNPIAEVSNLGKAASKLVPAAAEGSGVASKILSTVGSHALGSAVEGAAYGLGDVVSEQALGDPNLTAQSALAHVGLSAALGGALGSVVGAGELAIPPAIDAAKDAIGKVVSSAKGAASDLYPKAASAVTGIPEQTISEALANRAQAFVTPEERTKVATGLADSLNGQYKQVETALKTANRDIRPVESASLVPNTNHEVAQTEYTRLFNKLDDTIQEMKSKPEIYPGRYPAKLEELQKGLVRDAKAIESPADIFKALDDLKSNIDKNIKYGTIPSAADQDAQQVIKGLRFEIKGALENEGTFGQAGARQSAFNEAQNEYIAAKKEFQKNFMIKSPTKTGGVQYNINPVKVNTYFNQMSDARGQLRSQVLDNYTKASKNLIDQIEHSYKAAPATTFDKEALSSLVDRNTATTEAAKHQAAISKTMQQITTGAGVNPLVTGVAAHALGLPGTLVAAATEGYNALANPGATITRLANLERMTQNIGNRIDTGVKALVSGSTKAYNIGRGEVSAGLSRSFGNDRETNAKTYQKRISQVQMYAQNPDQFHQTLDSATKEVYEHAPNVATGIHTSAVAGVNFLASKVPQIPNQGPLAHKYEPSQTEMSTFNRYYDAVENPVGILKQAAAGTLTTEGIEAVKAVYPKLYEQMTSSILDKISTHKNVPYKSKLMLSLLLGQDMDGSTLPAMIQANQAAFAGNKKEDQPGPVKTTQTGLGSITLGNRLLTPSQASAQRS